MKLSHPNCMAEKCEVCLSEHEELGKYLDTLCGTGNRIDHLSKIHLWMSKQGINPETEWGWATPETFSEETIQQYVADFKKARPHRKRSTFTHLERKIFRGPVAKPDTEPAKYYCPYCEKTLPLGKDDYESCPYCKGGFGFHKPEPLLPDHKPDPAQYHDCPDCGYRISKEQREFAVVDLECPQCGGKKLSEFRESVQNMHDLPDTATGQVGGSNATHDPWTLGEYELYAQALQWAIFHHSQGNTVPQQMAERCPHYAKMLDNSLGAKPDTAPDTGEGDREKYYHIIKNCPKCGEPTLQSHQEKGEKPSVSREWVENTVRELEKPHTIGYATALLTERLIKIGVEVTRRTK